MSHMSHTLQLQLPMSVMPQKKPTTLDNHHIEGFHDRSTQAREKWGVKISTNFWTPCIMSLRVENSEHSSQNQPQHSFLPPSCSLLHPSTRYRFKGMKAESSVSLLWVPQNLVLYTANSQKSLGKGVTTNSRLSTATGHSFSLLRGINKPCKVSSSSDSVHYVGAFYCSILPCLLIF